MTEQPNERQRKVLVAIEKSEQLGSSVVINKQDAEECTDKGWAEPTLGGGYRITTKGRQVLRNTN